MDEQKFSVGNFILSAIATAFHFAFGGWSMALVCLIGLVVTDYLTGMGAAKRRGEIDSRIGKIGFMTKCLYFVAIVAMRWVDLGLGLPLPVLQTLATWNLILIEGESIIENLDELGVPLGTPLKKAFKRIKERDHDIPMP